MSRLGFYCLILAVVAAVATAGYVNTVSNTINTLGKSLLIGKFKNGAVPLQNGKCESVSGFPSSAPGTLPPFTRPWRIPDEAKVKQTYCDANNRCMDYFELVVQKTPVQVYPNGPATVFRTYNGSLLGPTIKMCRGRQSLVRIENGMPDRPFSTHLHGSGSAAPYDGWADDVTNPGDVKYYHYPNNRAATLWYHDHAVHNTAINAYNGIAAQYWVVDCNHPLEPIVPYPYDFEMLLGDKVFDANSQLLYDENGAHKDNLYGDHNTINGVTWPYLEVEPRLYRFRIVNTGITRPYMYRLSGGKNFWVIASDGGLLEKPVQTDYLRHGVAERWEIIIDFSDSVGKNVTLYNDALPSVPMFCQSHLLAQFRVTKRLNTALPYKRLPDRFFAVGDYPLNAALVHPDLIQYAITHKPENRLEFGKKNGQWLVNGVGWDQVDQRVQIKVKPNELSPWHIVNGGGGWFHPVHIHLIDFIVVKRNSPNPDFHPLFDSNGLDPYEVGAPKDVVYLGPGEDIEVVARYGPEVGRYMVHCHNLVHEDNDMLVAFSVEGKDAGEVPGSPMPVSPFNLTLADPMGDRSIPKSAINPDTTTVLKNWLARKTYEVFYPAGQQTIGTHIVNLNNFWEVPYSYSNTSDCFTCPTTLSSGTCVHRYNFKP